MRRAPGPGSPVNQPGRMRPAVFHGGGLQAVRTQRRGRGERTGPPRGGVWVRGPQGPECAGVGRTRFLVRVGGSAALLPST